MQGQGYSGSAENLLISLSKLGVDVSTLTFKNNKKNLTKAGKEVSSSVFRMADVGIAYGFPNSFSSLTSHKYKVGWTMFETTKCPSGKSSWAGPTGNWVDQTKNLDLLLSPSSYCKELFQKEGIKTPIEVVPLGVDTKMYPFIQRPRRPKVKKPFTFLMLGTLTLRKNPGYALSAFLELFKNNEDARLILKTQDGTLGHLETPHKNLIIIDRRATLDKMRQLYADADCFVFPTRGEGFGLPPLEAMSTGLPTIFPNHSGMMDFANDKYGYIIEKYKEKKAVRFPKIWNDVGNWFDPDYNELKELMRYVYEHRDEAYDKGVRASEWVKNNWTYDHSAKKLIEVLSRFERK